MSLKAKIKAGALSLGFADCGFSNVVPVPGIEQYQGWLARGQHAAMAYLADERAMTARSDPRVLLPSCRTVISLITAYPPPSSASPRAKPSEFSATGRIAAFALLPDYHGVIKERLVELAKIINELAGYEVESYACVDSAPILEGGYAQQAGLGWIGRNSLLFHPKHGSWTNLSELLVNLELEPDLPFEEEGCGACQICVLACPTNAIQPDRSIDARRCLSYLTIENRNEIPPEFRRAMGARIFGCDTCQSVCPVNKKAETAALVPAIEESPDLAESFRLTEGEFKQTYRRTPVWRAKYSGFRRNVANAMGNSGRQDFVPILEAALKTESDTIVADSIDWALSKLTGNL